MKLLIVVTCILANGQIVYPRGHYTTWPLCNKSIEYFQTGLYPSYENKHPLCWCHQADPEQMPLPERADDSDRKAPL